MSSLQVHRAWRLQRVAHQLFLSGGLDATYLLDELSGDPLDRFANAWDTGSLSDWPDLPQHAALADKLLMLGALFRPLDIPPTIKVGVQARPDFPWPRRHSGSMGQVYRLTDHAAAWVPQEMIGLGPREGDACLASVSTGLAAQVDALDALWSGLGACRTWERRLRIGRSGPFFTGFLSHSWAMGLQIRQKLSSLGPLLAFDVPSPTGS